MPRILRIILVVLAIVGIAYLANQAGDWIGERVKMEITPENEGVPLRFVNLPAIRTWGRDWYRTDGDVRHTDGHSGLSIDRYRINAGVLYRKAGAGKGFVWLL